MEELLLFWEIQYVDIIDGRLQLLAHRNCELYVALSRPLEQARLPVPEQPSLFARQNVMLSDADTTFEGPDTARGHRKPWRFGIRDDPEIELEGRVHGLSGCGVHDVHAILVVVGIAGEQADGVLAIGDGTNMGAIFGVARFPLMSRSVTSRVMVIPGDTYP